MQSIHQSTHLFSKPLVLSRIVGCQSLSELTGKHLIWPIHHSAIHTFTAMDNSVSPILKNYYTILYLAKWRLFIKICSWIVCTVQYICPQWYTTHFLIIVGDGNLGVSVAKVTVKLLLVSQSYNGSDITVIVLFRYLLVLSVTKLL